ncbi:MAG: cobyrinate a,c-diamide synthase [Acidimicrobiales bacterium]
MVVAGTHSGVGKTTVATGLMAALTNRGRRVGAAKVGPDFIDPGYHALATGRPSRNLDAWMCGETAVRTVAARAAAGCHVLVVEGVMGLFDGAAGGPFASTAHVAQLLDAPVLLVVDARAMSGSVAALVHGFASFDRSTRVAGLILNRVGSDSHETMLRQALDPLGVPILGVLRRDDRLTWRDRHLGLVPVVEDAVAIRAALDKLAAVVDDGCDLDAIEALAATAADIAVVEPEVPRATRRTPVAVANGPAFSFTYPDNLEALEAAGAELVPFDPLRADALPAGARGLVVGGGFPEVYAPHLSDNAPLLADVRRKIDRGLPTWAECGGLLWLAQSLDDHPMAGAVACDGRMTETLTLGYRTIASTGRSPIGPAGTQVRGHEFHYSTVDPPGAALTVTSRDLTTSGGFAKDTLLATYVHVHLASAPELADAFVGLAACAGQP